MKKAEEAFVGTVKPSLSKWAVSDLDGKEVYVYWRKAEVSQTRGGIIRVPVTPINGNEKPKKVLISKIIMSPEDQQLIFQHLDQ